VRRAVHARPCVLCLEATGEQPKGPTTDGVARQHRGRRGKIDAGLVSVRAYGVLEGLTFPRLVAVFKPRPCLEATDGDQATPPVAPQRRRGRKTRGVPCQLVVAARLGGGRPACLEGRLELGVTCVVALRARHGVRLGPGPRVRSTRRQPCERRFAEGRRDMRSGRLTTDPATLPAGPAGVVMTTRARASRPAVADSDGLRMGIADGFQPSTQAVGWADVRVAGDPAIETWWGRGSRAYPMVRWHAAGWRGPPQARTPPEAAEQATRATGQGRLGLEGGPALPEGRGHGLRPHQWWNGGKGGTPGLKNLRVSIQPVSTAGALTPWSEIWPLPARRRGLGPRLTCRPSVHRLTPS